MAKKSFMKYRVLGFIIISAIVMALSITAKEVSTPSYTISTDSIEEKIRIGNFLDKSITISNKGSDPLVLSASAEGTIVNILKFKSKSITIEPQKSNAFQFTLLGDAMGFYNGTILLSGDFNEKIAVNTTVTGLVGTPVEALLLDIKTLAKNVFIGNNFRYQVDVQNLLQENKYNVTLYYSIDWIEGSEEEKGTKLSFSDQEELFLNNTLTLVKEFNVPQFIRPGEYELKVRAEYLGLSAESSERFFIKEKVLDYEILGILPLRWLLFFFILCGVGLIGYFFYRQRKKKHRRYVSEVKLSLLPKLGPRSVVIGKVAEVNAKAYFEIDQLTTHTLIAGSTGGGKTVSAEVLVEEALLKGAAVVVFDPTAQWSGFLRKCVEKKMLDLYKNYNMKVTEARAFNGNVKQILNAREIIEIKKYIKQGEINVFAVNRLDPKDIDILVANTLKQVFDANLPESKELKLLIIFDEVHRLLPKFGGSGQGFLTIERACREFRKWGVGLFLISQVLTDFVGETKANINTEIQMRTRDQGDLERIKNKYGDYMLQSLLKASTGVGMLENPAFNNGNPYFVQFRPLLHEHARLTDEELENYNKFNTIIDDLDFQIDELKKLGLDVFDMQLELKMALDKVKSGNFNMVKIYLEGLTPRVHEEFQKKKMPVPVRKIKLIGEEELAKEYEKAKKEREELEKKGGVPKSAQKLQEAPPELHLQNGVIISDMLELVDAMTADEKIFAQEVKDTKNNIADWIAKIKPEGVEKVKAAKNTKEMVAALEEAAKPKEEKK